MTTPIPDDDPLELIERLLGGVVCLLCYAHEKPERISLERSWWSLRSLKRGAEAALQGTFTPRSLSRAGRVMLVECCDAERSNVYRCAAQLGFVPRVRCGTTTGPCGPPILADGAEHDVEEADPARIEPQTNVGSSLGNLMGL
ncbi:hypothetical protein [Nannocystis pusilla]|uniref:Uncharacterized protein n=1 Tax=Nannocystis pusilla TaxID=889268 RepID=A0ABS7TN34_9BACT|nr:hypothetical protein [Nannocystis pusilla]MBZ5709639.1 hypothetical protein [Nannocystis pusilla]